MFDPLPFVVPAHALVGAGLIWSLLRGKKSFSSPATSRIWTYHVMMPPAEFRAMVLRSARHKYVAEGMSGYALAAPAFRVRRKNAIAAAAAQEYSHYEYLRATRPLAEFLDQEGAPR